MTEQELQAIIFASLKKVAPESIPEDLDPDENFREELDIDSYTFLQMLVHIGEQTGVEVPEIDYGRVSTLSGMQGYLTARLSSPDSGKL
ncbi:acyl carrier protein [Desulfogranum japonicum]|uniref:acyl carrier protein n=1 Tax=Desulfogranum japonicum TaxID=231447 RepID=UPI000418AA2E|nr:acyl carrier protein [Desulfogranum japonicum]